MLMFITIATCLTFSINLLVAQPADPVVIAQGDGDVETVTNLSSKLLNDARDRKATNRSGYGAQYRRAAWAALDESATGDLTTSVAILQELLSEPETTFDAFDAYRMLGQMHAKPDHWLIAIDSYSLAILIADADVTLVESHPLVYASVCQGLAISYAATGQYAEAVNSTVKLRDHASTFVSHQTRQIAAYSTVDYARKSNNQALYLAAWQTLESNFPDRLSGRRGVVSRYLHAMTLVEFGENETEVLESLWAREDVRSHDNSVTIAIELAHSWLAQENAPNSTEFANMALQDAWNHIVNNEAQWLINLAGDQSKIDSLARNIKLLLTLLIETSIQLDLTEAEGYVMDFIQRYGDSDSRGLSWLNQVTSTAP